MCYFGDISTSINYPHVLTVITLNSHAITRFNNDS